MRLGNVEQHRCGKLLHTQPNPIVRGAAFEDGDLATLLTAVALVPLRFHAPVFWFAERTVERHLQHAAWHGIVFQHVKHVAQDLVCGVDVAGRGGQRRHGGPRLLRVHVRPRQRDDVVDGDRTKGPGPVVEIVAFDPGIAARNWDDLRNVVRPERGHPPPAVAHLMHIADTTDRNIGHADDLEALLVHDRVWLLQERTDRVVRDRVGVVGLVGIDIQRWLGEGKRERRDAGEKSGITLVTFLDQRAEGRHEKRGLEPAWRNRQRRRLEQQPRERVADGGREFHSDALS